MNEIVEYEIVKTGQNLGKLTWYMTENCVIRHGNFLV